MQSLLSRQAVKRQQLEPGEVINALRIEAYNKSAKKFRCLCLFCKSYCVVGRTNIRRQQTCGCLKSSTLTIVSFEAQRKVVCDCSRCGLRKTYDLMLEGEIRCELGCE
jgi:hypothetical protein